MTKTNRPVLIFDSGLGGLSVYAAVRRAMPSVECLYVADNEAFPYGDWPAEGLRDHIVSLIGQLIERFEPVSVVIACNTASTLVLNELRKRYNCPFVGTVPAIKPAAERSLTGVVSVLATPGTIARDYTRDLIETHAKTCHVRLVGAPDLAALAEAHLSGANIGPDDLREQILPCFYEIDGARSDIVVLGCTHFPFLTPVLSESAPWPVHWLDPAPAIARRLASLEQLGDRFSATNERPDLDKAHFTSADGLSERIRTVLSGFGLEYSGALA